MNHNPTPIARNIDLNGSSNGKTVPPPQVSTANPPTLQSRLHNLEAAQSTVHDEIDSLKGLYQELHDAFFSNEVKQQHHQCDSARSYQSAAQFKRELQRLSQEVNSEADIQKANSNIPSHVIAASERSLPPHLRNGRPATGHPLTRLAVDDTKHKHDPLATDGPIDTIVRRVPAAAPSPPPSPTPKARSQFDASVALATLDLSEWKPYYITTLAPLPSNVGSRIPSQQKMTTFTFDFLQNTFGGIAWSPGLRYISSGTTLLKNRTYYLLDPKQDPYLPKAAGEHGAKLTAFFNKPPEDEFDNLPDGTNSYTDVPMFVHASKGRYAYFGNYSQTRWSDKLDNDTMQTRVPQVVKEHIAKELAATPREPWVTQELKMHFFPMPKYEGALPTTTSAIDSTTISTLEGEKRDKQIERDTKSYIHELTEWERDANMKTAMIKADFVLHALDAADADEPPALRLWWEYLECVDWKVDFYNMLVGLQARHTAPK